MKKVFYNLNQLVLNRFESKKDFLKAIKKALNFKFSLMFFLTNKHEKMAKKIEIQKKNLKNQTKQ